MTNKDVREQITIGGDNYDCVYRSRITGKCATWYDLSTGRFDSKKEIDLRDKGHITPKDIKLVALRKRTKKKEKLIVDNEGWEKERCPRCFFAIVEEHPNKRISYSLGNNYPVLSSKVDYGTGRTIRYQETSKYCECCDTTYVAAKVVVNEY